MDALQEANDCMTELGALESYDYEGKELTLRYAQAHAAIAQAEALAKIAEKLEELVFILSESSPAFRK